MRRMIRRQWVIDLPEEFRTGEFRMSKEKKLFLFLVRSFSMMLSAAVACETGERPFAPDAMGLLQLGVPFLIFFL